MSLFRLASSWAAKGPVENHPRDLFPMIFEPMKYPNVPPKYISSAPKLANPFHFFDSLGPQAHFSLCDPAFKRFCYL